MSRLGTVLVDDVHRGKRFEIRSEIQMRTPKRRYILRGHATDFETLIDVIKVLLEGEALEHCEGISYEVWQDKPVHRREVQSK